MTSTWYFGLVVVLLAVVIASGGVALARRSFSLDGLRRHNEIAAPIHAAIGVMYAVLVAFVVIVVWEQHNDAESAVRTEANQIMALARDASLFSDDRGDALRRSLSDYAMYVVTTEWGLMEKGELHLGSSRFHDSIWNVLASIEPTGTRDDIWLRETVQRMNALEDARDERLLAVENTVPAAMWVLLTTGGLITVLFTAFFGAEHGPTHMVMVSALAVLVAFTLFLIAAIDQPFSGVVRVDDEAFRHALMQGFGVSNRSTQATPNLP